MDTTNVERGRVVVFEMPTDAQILKALIDRELESVTDLRLHDHIRRQLVEPTPVLRNWDYGKRGKQFVCWAILNDSDSNTGICYCENGFG